MKESTYTIQTIKPDNENNWLTNGKTFAKIVYLGESDSIDNWREISNEEKEELEQDGGDANV